MYAGFLQWKSTADILTNAEDSVIGKIKDKMTAIPVMLGATYYRKQVYATIEVGINNLNIKRETTYNGNDQAFIERNSGSDNKTCFAFSIGLGYEYKLNKKNSLNLELLYQRVLYNDPSLNFLGCRILYGIGF